MITFSSLLWLVCVCLCVGVRKFFKKERWRIISRTHYCHHMCLHSWHSYRPHPLPHASYTLSAWLSFITQWSSEHHMFPCAQDALIQADSVSCPTGCFLRNPKSGCSDHTSLVLRRGKTQKWASESAHAHFVKWLLRGLCVASVLCITLYQA